MNARVPGRAREVLDAGTLCYVGVPTPAGPHVTPVVYAVDGGRLWLTTARSSAKARAWQADRSAAGMVEAGGEAVIFRGPVRTYDALDPFTWPAAAAAGPRLLSAATRFGLRNARFFAGYAVDARRVPLAWTPPGRVFASVEPETGWVADTVSGSVPLSWGSGRPGGGGPASVATFASRRAGPALDRLIPETVREVLGQRGGAVLGLEGAGGITVLPVRFRRAAAEGGFDVAVPLSLRALADPPSRVRAALVIDRASRWRAAAMRGALVRGWASVAVPDEVRRGGGRLRERLAAVGADPRVPSALLGLRPRSVVWWDGWTSGTARSAHGG